MDVRISFGRGKSTKTIISCHYKRMSNEVEAMFGWDTPLKIDTSRIVTANDVANKLFNESGKCFNRGSKWQTFRTEHE
jgi:hypothetical protein